jgi:hypothetical protein
VARSAGFVLHGVSLISVLAMLAFKPIVGALRPAYAGVESILGSAYNPTPMALRNCASPVPAWPPIRRKLCPTSCT